MKTPRHLTLAAAALVALLLTGCGETAFNPQPPPDGMGGGGLASPYPGTGFTVQVQSGPRAIAGASIQLYAAGASGNGAGSSALLGSALTTDQNGTATVAAGYSCPAAGSMLYLLSSGGSVGAASANPGIRLLSAVGACNAVASGSTVAVNEVTTTAGAFALAQFYAPGNPPSVGSSSTNATGLANAFATAATLADRVSGLSPGALLPANAASPATRVNAIANALSTCVLSAAACGALFNATAALGITPSNTLDAAYLLARAPGAHVAAVSALALSRPVYLPALDAAPSDWDLFVTYSGGGMSSPSRLGVDSTGNVWVASFFNAASKFSPVGAAIFPSGITGFGLNSSYGLAVDLHDNVWILNEQPYTGPGSIGTVTKLNSAGQPLSGPNGFTAGGLNYPLSIAIDPNDTAWIIDYGNSYLTLLNASGVPLSGPSGITSPLFAFPVAVALDSKHVGWIGNQADVTITRVAPDGSSFSNINCCVGASGIAIDQADNVWVANFYGDSVSLVANSGTVLLNGVTAGGTINRPQGVAVDGNGNVWVANYRAKYLTELAGVNGAAGSTLSPPNGYGADAKLVEAFGLAIDASGNIWVSNFGSNTVTKFIGAAAPVRTPLSAQVKQP